MKADHVGKYMASLITELRRPKLDLFGTPTAVFDLSLTLVGAYLPSKKFCINPIIGRNGEFYSSWEDETN